MNGAGRASIAQEQLRGNTMRGAAAMAGGWLAEGASTQYTAAPRCTRVTRTPPAPYCSVRRMSPPAAPLLAASAVQRWCGTMRACWRSCALVPPAARRRSSAPQRKGLAGSEAVACGAGAASGAAACGAAAGGAVTVAAKAGTATACFLCTGTVRTLVAGCGPASCASGVADAAADANGGDVAIHTMAGARPAGAWKAAPGIACKGLRAAPHHHDSASACSSKDKPTAAPHRRVLASGLMVPRHPLHPVPTPAGRPAGTAGIRKWRPGFQSAPP